YTTLFRSGHRIEPPGPCRHHAAARIGNDLDDRRLVRAEQPDAVGQVRRAELAIALAFRAVTERAIVGVDLLARSEIDARASRQARQRAHVVSDPDDLFRLEQ